MLISAIYPLISAIFVCVLGLFIFIKNPRNRVNWTFSLHALVIAVWLFGTFEMFLSVGDNQASIFWDRFIYAGVVFIPACMYHFGLAITNKKRNWLLILAYILSVFFLIISRTDYFVSGVFIYQWGVHTRAQLFHHFFLLYFFSYVVIWFVLVYKYFRKTADKLQRQQLGWLFIAFLILFSFGPLGYLPAYGISIYPISYLSGLVFIIVLAYAITRYNLMNLKVIATEVFSVLLTIASLASVFQPGTTMEIAGRVVIFIVTLIFAILLIRSVHHEVHRREEMEALNKKLNKVTKDLADANKELKRLDESKSEFLSISSHQLRTPLTIIKGYSSMLLEGSFGKMTKPVKESVEKIFVSTERLINLVESLLNISRIEAGRIEFTIEPVDLTEVAKSMVNDFQTKAKARKLKLEFAAGEKVPKVAADAQKIKDIVSNLIDNAIKYTKKGEIMISLHQEGQSVVFASQDTGIGMDEEDIGRLFNKFTRGKDSAKVNTEGTGLGLYYARVLVENMGGRIWVESPGKGKGSKFSFSLPLADKSKAKKINT